MLYTCWGVTPRSSATSRTVRGSIRSARSRNLFSQLTVSSLSVNNSLRPPIFSLSRFFAAAGEHAPGPQTIFKKLEFPRTKEEIEQFVVNGFLRAARDAKLLPASVSASQNEQNSFDFQLLMNGNVKKYMELMEIAPLEHLRGSYDAAPPSYKPYDFARHIFEKVMKKSSHYGSVSVGLILLLYVTAWQFVLSETVIALLQFWLTHTQHKFDAVYCYSPIMQDSGVAHLFYPTPKEFWLGFDPEKFRNNEVLNFDVSAWQIISK